jgi:hypothetical protein
MMLIISVKKFLAERLKLTYFIGYLKRTLKRSLETKGKEKTFSSGIISNIYI